jgi:hypothetical protein
VSFLFAKLYDTNSLKMGGYMSMGIKSNIYFAGPNQRDLAHTIEPSRVKYVKDVYSNSPFSIKAVDIEIDINDFY